MSESGASHAIKTLLLIGAGLSQSGGITVARKMGYRVIAVDGDPEAYGLTLADVAIVIDVRDKRGILEIAKEHLVDGVFSVASDICLETVVYLTDTLRLPGMPPECLLPTVHKGVMREMLSANGVPGPKYYVIKAEGFLQEAAEEVGFPAVIKPVDSAGSRGVSLVDKMSDLADAYHTAQSCSFQGISVLEQFMPGPEISVEAFVVNGVAHILTLSDKDRTDPPNLLDTSVTFPSHLDEAVQKRVKAMAVLAIKTLGIDNCPVHMEIILTPEGPKVVELAARGPGFRVYTDIIPYVTGVNGIEAQIRLLSGETPNLKPQSPLKGACIKFFGSKTPGVVKDLTNSTTVTSHPDVFDLQIYVKPGDKVNKLTCGSDRLGHVITLSETRQQAVALANHVHKSIEVELC